MRIDPGRNVFAGPADRAGSPPRPRGNATDTKSFASREPRAERQFTRAPSRATGLTRAGLSIQICTLDSL